MPNCTPATPTSSEATAPNAIVPVTTASVEGVASEMSGGVVSLATNTTTLAVCWLPAASRAVAVRTCAPLGTVTLSQFVVYGAAVCGVPRLTPSTANCTLTTPLSSDAAATTAIVPVTIAFAAGVMSETVGGVVSFATVTLTVAVC